jgi:hypothetical protein
MRGPQGPTGPTGPTRAGYDWSVQASPATTSNRWPRTGSGSWLATLCGQIFVGATVTLTKLQLEVYGTPLTTDTLTFTLQKNGVDTGLSVTLAAGATSASATGSLSLLPTDYLTARVVQSSTEGQPNMWLYMLASD